MGLGGRPPDHGRPGGLGGYLLRGLAVDGVTSSGGVKLGSSSTGGVTGEMVLGGFVVMRPSFISFKSKSMKGSVETGLIAGGGVFLTLLIRLVVVLAADVGLAAGNFVLVSSLPSFCLLSAAVFGKSENSGVYPGRVGS